MGTLDADNIRLALRALGRRLGTGRRIELLLVGGAAGVLTGELPAIWTTADVDLIHCRFPADRESVLVAAEAVGRELSLPASWLSEDVGLFSWTLPPTWKLRRKLVGTFGRVHVFAVGRIDLICMKFVAHRARDLEHLVQMAITRGELSRVRRYLIRLARKYRNQRGQIEMAKAYVNEWKVK